MRPYKRLAIICVIFAVISLGIAMLLNFAFSGLNLDFWVNIFLGIFGSAVLTLLNSIVFYQYERRKTLENFTYQTQQILKKLNEYRGDMPLNQKINFFLEYNDLDKTVWDTDFGEMDFFFECLHGHQKYIYEKIYRPILEFNKSVVNHIWQFRLHLDGTGTNERAMQSFVSELEEILIQKTEQKVPVKYDDKGNVTGTVLYITSCPRLCDQIVTELSGRYSDIMYSKKKYRGDKR